MCANATGIKKTDTISYDNYLCVKMVMSTGYVRAADIMRRTGLSLCQVRLALIKHGSKEQKEIAGIGVKDKPLQNYNIICKVLQGQIMPLDELILCTGLTKGQILYALEKCDSKLRERILEKQISPTMSNYNLIVGVLESCDYVPSEIMKKTLLSYCQIRLALKKHGTDTEYKLVFKGKRRNTEKNYKLICEAIELENYTLEHIINYTELTEAKIIYALKCYNDELYRRLLKRAK